MVRKLSKRLNSKSLSKRLKSKRLSKRKKMSIQKGGDHADVYLIALDGVNWATASPGQVASIKEYTTELSKEGKEVNGNMIRTIMFGSAVYDQILNNETKTWHLIYKVELPEGFDETLTQHATNTLTDPVYISEGDPV